MVVAYTLSFFVVVDLAVADANPTFDCLLIIVEVLTVLTLDELLIVRISFLLLLVVLPFFSFDFLLVLVFLIA